MPIRVTVLHKSADLTHRDLIIGRGDVADLRVDDRSLSRAHASLRMEGGRVRLTDLASANGTRVNGEPVVGSRIVEVSDRIELGSIVVGLQLVTGTPGTVRSRLDDETLGQPPPPDDETRTVKDRAGRTDDDRGSGRS